MSDRAGLLDALPARVHARARSTSALAGALDAFADAARCSPFAAAVDLTALVRHAAERLDQESDPAEALAAIHAADLCLAFACLRGVGGATEALEERTRLAVVAGVRRVHPSGALIDDIRQRVLEHVLIGPDRRPRLEDYAGRGSLDGWLRIIAVRCALRERAQGERERVTDCETLFDAALPPEDPVLAHLKAEARAAFKAAFAASLAALSHFDREVLAAHLIGGASIDELAAAHGVHRATTARWLGKIRDALERDTRRRLRVDLDLDEADLDSLLRLVASRLSASVERLLGDAS